MRSVSLVVFALLLLPPLLFSGGRSEAAPAAPVEPATGENRDAAEGAAGTGTPASDPATGLEFVPGGISPIRGFSTDFTKSLVPADEILSGGPPKDGIPSIDRPQFVSVGGIDWLAEDEPVIAVTADGRTHLYPLQILMFHEIVNDSVGDVPLAVTYCPLCNTSIVFRREVGGEVLEFGTTGRLRYSNLLMYDRQTESWWQQATGLSVIGRYAGTQLEIHPSLMLPWDRAVERFPDARVLSRDTGYPPSRYGTNPYTGYDSSTSPFLYRGPEVSGQYDPMARVIQVVVEGESLAVAYPLLREELVVEEEVGGRNVVVFWAPGTASALDASAISRGRDVGSANAFLARAGGRALTFRPMAGDEADPSQAARFVDNETGTLWDVAGEALSGELAGQKLEPVPGIQHFWFSYNAFAADGVWNETRLGDE